MRLTAAMQFCNSLDYFSGKREGKFGGEQRGVPCSPRRVSNGEKFGQTNASCFFCVQIGDRQWRRACVASSRDVIARAWSSTRRFDGFYFLFIFSFFVPCSFSSHLFDTGAKKCHFRSVIWISNDGRSARTGDRPCRRTESNNGSRVKAERRGEAKKKRKKEEEHDRSM